MNILFIIGLPCSGKTYLANKISKGLEKELYSSNSYPIPIIDDPLCITTLISKLDNLYNKFENSIICDPWLCLKYLRDDAEEQLKNRYNLTFNYIYFENDHVKCLNNLERRIKEGDAREVKNFILTIKDNYIIPNNIIPIKIYDGK